MEYSIRRTNIDDFETVFGIKKNALGNYIEQTWGWDEDFQRKMQIDEFKTENISLIEVDGKTIGTIGINEKEDNIIISRLYIIDSYQSKGIGSKIINDIIDKYPGKTLQLGVLKVNSRAKKLYEGLGFKVYGEENEHYKMEYKS